MHSKGAIQLPQFRDSIHGFIEVSPLELKIIDSAPFQRLRNIKQLATTYLVYPGAEHTRFSHSLGVMHLVSRAYDSALSNYKKDKGCELFESPKKEWYRQILRLIALTHDLGHAPFSHASEALFDTGVEHEDFTQKILVETEIAKYIRDIGNEFCQHYNVGDEYSITPELLWLIYGEKNPELNLLYIMPDFKFLKSFMDSELDCDKMDYLLRDSYYCGVNYGKYDLNRLISSLSVYNNSNENIMQLAVKQGGVHAFEEFIIARYFMFIQVYFHRTRRFLDKLLVENISRILPSAKYPTDVDEYLLWDDQKVITEIKKRQSHDDKASQFINRQIMPCVYETDAHSNSGSDTTIYNMIRKALEKDLNCEIIEDTASKLAHKIPILRQYDSDSGKGTPILTKNMNKPASISAQSLLLQSLIGKPINIRRIYVGGEHAKDAKNLVRSLIN